MRRYALAVLSVAAGILHLALPAYPGQFDIQPVSIEFSHPGEVTLLAVRNTDDHPLRFQLETFAWEQNRDGTLELADTDDILYFPQLFELAPGATQNIRVGTTATPGPSEKTYRIFIEQLLEPIALTAPPTRRTIRLQVAPKVGVPIFIRPAAVTKDLRVGDIVVADGVVTFDLQNTGAVHLFLSRVRIEGRSRSGAIIFSREQPGWYLLSGGAREYRLPVSPSDCASLSGISIQVATSDGQNYEGKAAVPSGACSPGIMAGAH